MLKTGLGGNFSLAAWPGTTGTNVNASPQGPQTAAQQGFGTVAGDSGKNTSATTTGVLSVGTLALIALVWVWWALPR
jgi:hypothetical protein